MRKEKKRTNARCGDYITHRLLQDHRGGVLAPAAHPAVLNAHERGLLDEGMAKVDARFGGRRQFCILLEGLLGQIIGHDAERRLGTDPGKQRIGPASLSRPLLPGIGAADAARDTHTEGALVGRKARKWRLPARISYFSAMVLSCSSLAARRTSARCRSWVMWNNWRSSSSSFAFGSLSAPWARKTLTTCE